MDTKSVNKSEKLVTIADARSMYSKSERECDSKGKVLIFKREGLHFGLVVDAVEAIVSFSDSDKAKLPELFYNSHAGQVSEDLCEAVEVNLIEGGKKSMLILNAKSIADRVEKAFAS